MRKRPVAAGAAAEAEEPRPAASVVEPPKRWHEYLSVRFILFALAAFAAMHLFLWKVVHDFWRDQNHERLRSTVREAWDSLSALRDHL